MLDLLADDAFGVRELALGVEVGVELQDTSGDADLLSLDDILAREIRTSE